MRLIPLILAILFLSCEPQNSKFEGSYKINSTELAILLNDVQDAWIKERKQKGYIKKIADEALGTIHIIDGSVVGIIEVEDLLPYLSIDSSIYDKDGKYFIEFKNEMVEIKRTKSGIEITLGYTTLVFDKYYAEGLGR